MKKRTKTKTSEKFDVNKMRVTVSLTKAEAEWLAWLVTDHLKTYTFSALSKSARNKILQCLNIFGEVEAFSKGTNCD